MKYEYLCAAVISGTREGGLTESLAVVSDRRLTMAALAALLLSDPRRVVTRTARGMEDVRAALSAERPAVIVADGTWREWPQALDPLDWNGRILLLLDPEDDAEAFVQAVRSRAQGYLSRTASPEALFAAIDTVRGAGYYLDPVVSGRILWAAEESRTQSSVAPEPELSQRERQILVDIARGRSSKEIAREYAVTAKTVCNHVSNIYNKLNLSHRGQLVLYAAQEGLTSV